MSATVVGGAMLMHHRALELLADAGFRVCAEPVSGALIVLLGRPGEAARLRELRELAQAHPDADILVVVPGDASNASLRRILLAGATAIVVESEVPRALVPSARATLAGQLAVPKTLGRQIAPRPLSHREKEILALVVLGLTNRQIAIRLFLAESTVKTHVSAAFRKLDVRSRAEAVARIQDPETACGVSILALADSAAAAAA